MFRRILIANRGEIALRIIRACHELGVEAVAVYSTVDEESLHVKAADRAVCIGPPPAGKSYLSTINVIAAAKTTGCEAVHPGYGFLAENSDFARTCEEQDLVFIGPTADGMDELGDKSLAKQLMREGGLPTIPGSDGAVESVAEAEQVAQTHGYPVMIKASAGGGGRGMRLVREPAEMKQCFPAASAEAEAAFGNGALYLEKAILEPHHVEVQVIGDGAGGILALGERDCSIQRRNQKILEESPSPLLDDETRDRLQRLAHDACARLRYRSAGTLEFLADGEGNFYFMEMNTRIQVEHPVTEMVTGVDIVKEQIRVAAGGALPLEGEVVPRGYAMEFRINAEDPSRHFMPSGGNIENLCLPGGPGVRVDTHLYEGYRVPTQYDSLLAKVIVWDQDRSQCVSRGRRALSELVVAGVPTNTALHLDILNNEAFEGGLFSTSFLEEQRDNLESIASGEKE